MRRQRYFALLISFLIAFLHTAGSQPYYYYHRTVSDVRYARAYRVNLTTGQEELLLSDSMRIINMWPDPSQKWVYVDVKGDFLIVDADNPSIIHRPLGSKRTGGIAGARYFPKLNRFYLSWIEGIDGVGSTSTGIFDGTSFKQLDSPAVDVGIGAIVSEDESVIYQYAVDSVGNNFVLCSSTASNSVTEWRPFINVGPPTDRKISHGGANGKILISYRKPEDGKTVYANYQVVDLSTNHALAAITVPWKSEAYLSSDAQTVVVEEVSLALSPLGNRRFRPGNVYTFEATTGKLKQKFSLPPDGVVMLFDTYPDKFFYFNKLTMQALSGDVTAVTPASAFLDSLITLKHQAEQKNWLGDRNFVQELDNGLENAKKHLARGDSLNCAKELSVFQNKVKSEFDKKSTQENKRFVTEEAYKQLYFNAQYTIDRLPKK